MAETLKEFNFPNKADRYDWDRWFDGRIWRVQPEDGRDPNAFRSLAHYHARRRGGKVRTKPEPDGSFVLQFYIPDDGDKGSD